MDNNTQSTPQAPAPQAQASQPTDYGFPMIAAPVIGTALVVFWVADMNLLQRPQSSLNLIALGVVGACATLVYMEGKAFGAGSSTDLDKKGKRRKNSPGAWSMAVLLMWLIAFPLWLLERRHYGRANLVVVGLLATLAFTVSWGGMSYLVHAKVEEIRQSQADASRALEQSRELMRQQRELEREQRARMRAKQKEEFDREMAKIQADVDAAAAAFR